MTTTRTSTDDRLVAQAVGWLSVVGAIGSAALAVGHLGIDVPLLSALGPEGGGVVVPAAVAFLVGTVGFATVAYGAFTHARWTWTVGVVWNVLAVLAGIGQYRGVASAIGIVVALAALAVLVSPPGRRALRR